MLRLDGVVASIRDSRKEPRISTGVVARSVLVMLLSRLGSLNAIEQTRSSECWPALIGAPLPSADTMGRVVGLMKPDLVREAIRAVYGRLRRNKAFRPAWHGFAALVVDGHESHASRRRHCDGCLSRKVRSGEHEFTEYYHRQVYAQLLGRDFAILLDLEPQRPGEDEVAAALVPPIQARGYRLLLEPGRFIVGNAGILVTKVLYVKESGERRFIVCDAAMNDLVRPALYGSYHRIWPVAAAAGEGEPGAPGSAGEADIVGPICEVGDFLGTARPFPAVRAGDLVAVFTAGAYGMSMASNYNSRPLAAEVMVHGSRLALVRQRQSYADIWAREKMPAWLR